MKRFLIIQTAFIGDVILATPVIEAIYKEHPEASIDFLLRKGNEGLLESHPIISNLIIWDKKAGKYAQMLKLIRLIRKNKYDVVINLQRFLSTGLFTVFSGATQTIGFTKNPLSLFFTKRYPHIIDVNNGLVHEVDRNLSLIASFITNKNRIKPKLYPTPIHFEKVKSNKPYITISPTSVWFTKQFPKDKWIEFIKKLNGSIQVCIIGSANDKILCEDIITGSGYKNSINFAGELNLLETAALMKNAKMNFVNDSAPMHIASAMNAPVSAIFCSTVPAFGFGPLSIDSHIFETEKVLECKPCGIHGLRSCPENHFECAYSIDTDKFSKTIIN